MAAVAETTRGRPTEWARKYPPLLAVIAAALIVLGVLPSSLNLPQANPSQTLEFAPVPPDDDTPPPAMSGNLSSLGLAGSSSLESLAATTTTMLDNLITPGRKNRSTATGIKNCVGDPPKQTEDPLAPPCVSNFEGDNFGATYQGVTGEEIRILVYFEGFTSYTQCSKGAESTPDGKLFDLWEEPDPGGEHCMVRVLRGWQKYFNTRYQTYKRDVHFFAFFATGGLHPTAASRKADAADNYSKVKPFAVLSYGVENNDAYLESMARKGVLNFGAFVGRPAAFFAKYPKLVWGFYPSLEQQARMFTTYVCKKAVDRPVSFSGNPENNDDGRIYGMWSSKDKDRPDLQLFADLVKQQLEACGVTFKAHLFFPTSQYVQDNSTTPQYAADAATQFRDAGVTTLIWPGGLETNLSKSAGEWRPEIVAAGDLFLDGNSEGHYQQQDFWRNAWIVSNTTFTPLFEQTLCAKALAEAQPTAPRDDVRYSCDLGLYNDLRQLFTGIQVAGPRLGPTSVDKGYRAIPKGPSGNREVPACFYEPGDYTCTKDAVAQWWDPTGDSPNNDQAGCWRMTENGKRYLSGTWPDGNVTSQRSGSDPCNGFNGGGLTNPNPPSPGA
ncbi:MAG TPA: hypothetical protein VM938_12480 [Acidimicrobiales bacterium]|nr:hypothetical protein [Acidimicrobiales bacterium]